MVDWDGLENRSRCKPTVGSNPTPSASLCRVATPSRSSRSSASIVTRVILVVHDVPQVASVGIFRPIGRERKADGNRS